ncbi:oxygen-insensitive NAD(P)H nitroreductase [Tatumella saanichensis]|uniref:oxygen-insensitive NAD(P)H nitroreductase n=1 Tax=Tatumella saanichensis TaxID=480813 RepID=UPI0004A41CB9|nr:oxygen-insensitive NAD(P)H nitroreductase [Tatumella saanichensis]
MSIVDVVKQRFTSKAYDASRKLSDEQQQQILDILRYSPSSLNLQPWHFVAVTSEEGKEKILPAIRDFNAAKVRDAAMVVVFASKDTLDDAQFNRVQQQELQDGRFKDEASATANDNGRRGYIAAYGGTEQDLRTWMERQTYISLGFLLLGAAEMGLNATPIEGIDPEKLDEVLSLKQQGLHSLSVVAIGYNSEKDFNASLPKSRLAEELVITRL